MTLFAREANAVVVTFNYRVNLYGFLNLSFINGRFEPDCGLMDQIMALKFTRKNIANFCGDPHNITAFGQSAGAACIFALMQRREDLFDKCILQSPCAEHFFTEEEAVKVGKLYLTLAGVKHAEDIFNLSKEKVIEANSKLTMKMRMKRELRCAFSPYVDGTVIRKHPMDMADIPDIPMLIGNTETEGDLFVDELPKAAVPFIAMHMRLHVKKGKESYRRRASDALSEEVYKAPIRQILEKYPGPAWKYEYCYPYGRLGTGHAGELPVLFTLESDDVAHDMRRIWGTFAREGRLPWKEYRDGLSEYKIEHRR